MCLGVTCHLHFWKNEQGPLYATEVTQGRTDTKKESAHKVNPGNENLHAAPAGIQTRNFSITCPTLYQQAIPTPLF